MRGAILLLGLASSACLESVAIRADAPEEVDYIGLARMSDGRIVQATGLRPVSDDNALAVEIGDGAELVVLGYRESDLRVAAGGSLPSIEVLSDATLHSPEPCEPELPAPSWAQTVEDGGASSDYAGPALRVAAAWTAERCPNVPDLSFAIDCAESWCEPAVASLGRCGASADLCLLPNLTVTVDAESRLCLAGPSGHGTFGSSSELEEFDELGGRCRISVHSTHSESLDIDTIDFMEPLGWTLRSYTERSLRAADAPATHQYDAGTGFASDMLVRGDHVVVAATQDGNVRFCAWGDTGPTQLLIYDLEGRLTATATAAQCLVRLQPDPDGAGFWAVHGVLSEESELVIVLVHYDFEGRILRSLSLPMGVTRAIVRDFLIHGPYAIITVGLSSGEKVVHSGIFRIDLRTFEWVYEPRPGEDVHLDALVGLGPDAIALLDDGENSIEVWQPSNPGQSPQHRITSMELGQPLSVEDKNLLFIFGRDLRAGGYTLLYDLSCILLESTTCPQRSRQYFVEDHLPMRAVRTGPDELTMLVGVQRGPIISTILTRFDLSTETYAALRTPIADTIVTEAMTDSNGAIWALVPEEGHLLRIRRASEE